MDRSRTVKTRSEGDRVLAEREATWDPPGSSRRFQPRVVLLMALGHLTSDLCASFLTPILPLIIQRFGLSLALAGFLTTSRKLAGSMAQPIYGFLGDRFGRRWLMGLGPLFAVAAIGLTGWAPNYAILVLLVILAGIGSGAFHPQGAVVAAEASGDKHGLGMGVFSSGGTLGVALAPWLVVPLVSRWGLRATLVAAVPGMLLGLFLLISERHLDLGAVSRRQTWRPDLGGHEGTLGLLLAIAVGRTVVEGSIITFLPILMTERGFTLMGAGAVLSLYLLCTALAAMAGGYLGDLIDPRRVIGVTLILAIPFLQWALRADGSLMIALLIVGGVFLMASASLNTVLAQRLAPRSPGMASSVGMGLAFGIGGIGVTLVGRLADAIGLVPAFLWLCWVPLIPAALSLLLPQIARPVPELAEG